MKKPRERGAAAVEFALILPVLVLILFGIIEFGLLLYDKQVITNASREGARAGIVQAATRPDSAAITSVVTNYASNYLVTFADGTVNPSVTLPMGACVSFGTSLKVSVTYQYTFLVLKNLGFTGPLLTANTTMRCE